MVRTIIAAAIAAPTVALAQTGCPPLGPGQIGLGQYCKETATVVAATTPPTAAPTAALQPAPASITGVAQHATNSMPGPHAQPAPTPSAPLPPPLKTWRIEPADGRLANAFDRWARAEGMRLVWDARQHISISAGDSFEGTLENALKRVLSSPAIKSTYPLEVCFYPNVPPVMRVTELGEQKGCAQ